MVAGEVWDFPFPTGIRLDIVEATGGESRQTSNLKTTIL